MAKPIILAALLAAASSYAISSVSAIKTDNGGASSLHNPVGGAKPLTAGTNKKMNNNDEDGYWTDLFSPPYGDCPDVMVGISCMNTTRCFIPAGINGVGFGMMSFDGQAGGKFTRMPMDVKALMLMAVDVRGNATKPAGAAGGIGFFGGGISYLAPGGREWAQSYHEEPMVAGQCIRTSPDGERVLYVANEKTNPHVLLSTNSGRNFTAVPLNIPAAAGLRYAAMPSKDVWYVTGGTWPSNAVATADENNKGGDEDVTIFNNDAFKATAGKAQRVHALSHRLAVVLDKASGKVSHRLRKFPSSSASSSPLSRPTPLKSDQYVAQVFKTTDGGKSFSNVFTDFGSFYFNGIDCVSITECYAVGCGDVGTFIYGTKDSGATWKKVYETGTDGSFSSLMSIAVTDGTIIAAGGHLTPNGIGSLILTSRDGETWTEQPSLPNIGDIASLSLLPGGYGFGAAITTYQASTIIALRPKGSPTLPPAPTQPSFAQVTCDDDKCSEGCSKHSFPQNKCLNVNGGGSALVFCSETELIQDFYPSSGCSGNSTRQTMPLNVCLKSSSGGYFENVCN